MDRVDKGEDPGKIEELENEKASQILSTIAGDAVARAFSSAIDKMVPRAFTQLIRDLGYTEEVTGLAQFLAAKSGDSVETVLKKSLNLYGLALDAHEHGNRLAILSPDDEILREITGVGHVEEQPQPAC